MRKYFLTLLFSFAISTTFGQSYEDHLKKGFMWFQMEDYINAIKEFNSAIKFNSKGPGAYYLRGRSKAILKDYRGAIIDFNTTIGLNPDFADVYLDRGACKIQLGEKESGCLDLSKAGELGQVEAYDVIRQVCN